jgi:hypothetical protein
MKHLVKITAAALLVGTSAYAADQMNMSYQSSDGARCSIVKSASRTGSVDATYENPLGGYGSAATQTKLKIGGSLNFVLSNDEDQGAFNCENLMQQDEVLRQTKITQANIENESLRLQLEQLKAQLEQQQKQAADLEAMQQSSDW